MSEPGGGSEVERLRRFAHVGYPGNEAEVLSITEGLDRRQIRDPLLYLRLLVHRLIALRRSFRFEEARQVIRKIEALKRKSRRDGDTEDYFVMQLEAFRIELVNDNYTTAIEYLLEASATRELTTAGEAILYVTRSWMFSMIGDIEHSLEMVEKVVGLLGIRHRYDTLLDPVAIYVNISWLRAFLGQNDEAFAAIAAGEDEIRRRSSAGNYAYDGSILIGQLHTNKLAIQCENLIVVADHDLEVYKKIIENSSLPRHTEFFEMLALVQASLRGDKAELKRALSRFAAMKPMLTLSSAYTAGMLAKVALHLGDLETLSESRALQAQYTEAARRGSVKIVGDLLRLGERLHQLNEKQSTLSRKLKKQTVQLKANQEDLAARLAVITDARDHDTGEHIQRVGRLAAALATELQLKARSIHTLEWAARLHDIGKIVVSDAILLKEGRLTEDEYEAMKKHTTAGGHLLAGGLSAILKLGRQIAEAHHERWDGQGYPAGLQGEDIPMAARIVAVADVFDAMTHKRPYKPARPLEEALQEIQANAGTQFDPRVVEALQALHLNGLLSKIIPLQDDPHTPSSKR